MAATRPTQTSTAGVFPSGGTAHQTKLTQVLEHQVLGTARDVIFRDSNGNVQLICRSEAKLIWDADFSEVRYCLSRTRTRAKNLIYGRYLVIRYAADVPMVVASIEAENLLLRDANVWLMSKPIPLDGDAELASRREEESRVPDLVIKNAKGIFSKSHFRVLSRVAGGRAICEVTSKTSGSKRTVTMRISRGVDQDIMQVLWFAYTRIFRSDDGFGSTEYAGEDIK